MNHIDNTPNSGRAKKRSSNGDKATLPRICVSVREASEISGLSKSTLYKLISDGRLLCSKVDGRKLIWLKDLYKFLDDARHPQ